MTKDEAITAVKEVTGMSLPWDDRHYEALQMAIEALNQFAEVDKKVSISRGQENDKSIIYRQAAIDWLTNEWDGMVTSLFDGIKALPSAQPEPEKYEYHYDHTDCIWYRPEARNRCPVTCAQYRDGWNDAMNYIFRDGKGYMPYRRDKQYEG